VLANVQSAEASKTNVASNWASEDKFTSDMTFVQNIEPLKAYRVMDHTGTVLDKSHEPNITEDFAVNLYKKMSQLHTMDGILYEAQRQGRISFYMTHYGEEATMGTAAALNAEDMIFGQVS
jgi:2-oxoisovalerate dehydrogenase E1 component alpha subunit